MVRDGQRVRVTADWHALPSGAKGEVLGEVSANPSTCLVRFSTGTQLVPTILLQQIPTAPSLAEGRDRRPGRRSPLQLV